LNCFEVVTRQGGRGARVADKLFNISGAVKFNRGTGAGVFMVNQDKITLFSGGVK